MMEMDVLAILMVAFGLFALLMFVLFYIYAKRIYNEKHLQDDLDEEDELDTEVELVNVLINGINYIFDANGNNLKYGDQIKALVNGSIYDGVVTRSNYKDYLDNFSTPLQKLEIESSNNAVNTLVNAEKELSVKENEDIENPVIENTIINNSFDYNMELEEYVPRKKNTI